MKHVLELLDIKLRYCHETSHCINPDLLRNKHMLETIITTLLWLMAVVRSWTLDPGPPRTLDLGPWTLDPGP